ncbi:MAG TPA: methylenetetrahydrofolate reductase [Desulfuromonadales bacterium]|nr:methylenetetrahydrofolate reductase [Desulfuromonadales bacterium]
MRKISIELVPRHTADLLAEMQLVRQHFPSIDTTNIPDLLKFRIRSWEACRQARDYFSHAIPHLRAIDFDLRHPLPLQDMLGNSGIDTVLVIAGDQPQDMSRRTYRTSSVEMIRALKKQMPELKVFAGIDPYRCGFREELDYVKRKVDAGADGFFTQPFFDLRLLCIWHDQLQNLDIFWGVTPVTSQRSRDYWENLNQAVFPADFQPTLAWNRRFAETALAFARQADASLYFMPIRVDLVAYLSGLLD